MSNERKNAPISRPVHGLLAATADPLAGTTTPHFWYDGTTHWFVDADGTQSPIGPAAVSQGCIPSARKSFSVQPTANDTLTLGGVAFTFVASLGAANSTVQVLRGASAAAALANFVNAVNNDAASKGTTWLDATTPWPGLAVADAVTGTQVRLRNALTRGGAAAPGVSPSMTLAASISGDATTWTVANLNAMGKAKTDTKFGVGKVTVLAAMIANGTLWIELPFTPTIVWVQVQSSSGVLRAYSDVTAINGNAIQITLGGGASPNIQANDVVSFEALA